jgi:hypothetical protein
MGEHQGVDSVNPAERWKDYRRCTGKLTWRLATPDDLPSIRKMRNISERFLHQKQSQIGLFSPPVLLTLVAENERGKIVDCLYVQSIVEISKISCTEAGFEETAGLEADLYAWLREIGFKQAIINTNHGLREWMRPVLEKLGFTCKDDTFSRWVRHL